MRITTDGFQSYATYLLMLILLSRAACSGAGVLCSEPSDDMLRIDGDDDIHESFLLLNSHQHRHTLDFRSFKNVQRTYINGDNTTCRADSKGATVSDTSVCRWHYVLNFDVNRRPQSLIEARCNCKHHQCAGSLPGSRCVPVFYYARVLRKAGCDVSTRTFVYRHTTEPIAVGCTCAVRWVSYNGHGERWMPSTTMC